MYISVSMNHMQKIIKTIMFFLEATLDSWRKGCADVDHRPGTLDHNIQSPHQSDKAGSMSFEEAHFTIVFSIQDSTWHIIREGFTSTIIQRVQETPWSKTLPLTVWSGRNICQGAHSFGHKKLEENLLGCLFFIPLQKAGALRGNDVWIAYKWQSLIPEENQRNPSES